MYDDSNLSAETHEYDSWPDVLESELSDEDLPEFKRRKNAVKRKIDGDRNKAIENITGFDRREVRRYIQRCRSPHPNDGKIWGFRILVPGTWAGKGKRRKPPEERDGPGGDAYAFSWLLETYPDIEKLLINLFLGKAKKGEVVEIAMCKDVIHQAMLEALRAKGFSDKDYPFYRKDKAKRSVELYLEELYDSHFREIVKNQHGVQKARNMGSGKMQMEPPATRPGEQMEADEHILDAEFEISYDMGRYPPKTLHVKRPRLLALICRQTHVVWAYLLVLAEGANHLDILRLFKRYVRPWELRPLPEDGPLRYREGAGMPSEVFEVCRYSMGDEFYLDNAFAHSARESKRVITDVMGATLILGRYKSPKDRPYIENLFKKLERYIHRLPSTTGSHKDDVRNQNPKEAARKYKLDVDDLNDILSMVIANYNATKQPVLSNSTPLEMLGHNLAGRPMRMLLDPEDLLAFNLKDERIVRGSKKEGRRPYIQYEHVRYSSESLGKTPSMIGQKLFLYVDYDDISQIKVYLEDGTFFDVLIPKSRNWQQPHMLEYRKMFFRNEEVEEEYDSIRHFNESLPNRSKELDKPKTPPSKKTKFSFKALSWRDEGD